MDKKVKKLYKGLNGSIKIPADKSISHRAIMFSSLANGKSTIKNFSKGQDPNSTLKIFKQLGVDFNFIDEQTLTVVSPGKFNSTDTPLDCGNSGTTMRLVSGILAGLEIPAVLIGDESLSKRPMKRIIEPLSLMGANIQSTDGHAPLIIQKAPLHSINYASKLASAQVKSCILLAGLNTDGTTTVTEPSISRNHTELMLKYMGADINTNGKTVSITKSTLEPKTIEICGDISSAAYFIVAALIVPGSDVILQNVGLNPTRTGILEVCRAMGADIEILNQTIKAGEPVGDIRIKYSSLKACNISGETIPKLIDELPVIAVLATQAQGETRITDAKDLRNKESDRITVTVNALKKLGANIEELDDGFVIQGKTQLRGGVSLETFHDHRIAMSLFVAGLICPQEILIEGFEWAGISFPEFEELFNSLM